MTKRVVLLSIIAGVIFALGASTVWAKAHVPLGRAQICTKQGKVKNISARLMQKRLNGGACRLTACAFNDEETGTQYIFLPGDPCDATDANEDRFCDATGSPRDVPTSVSAINVTPACTDPF